MKVAIILLFVCSMSYGQKKDELRTVTNYSYIRVGASGATTFCGMTKVTKLMTNKKIYLKTDYITLDLKVIQRSKDSWIAVDRNKNAYTITSVEVGGEIGILIVPNDMTIGLLGVAHCNTFKICQ